MMPLLSLALLATWLDFVIIPPFYGLNLRLVVIVLLWLAPTAEASSAALITLSCGLLLTLVLPGPIMGLVLAFAALAAMIYVTATMVQREDGHYQQNLLSTEQLLGLTFLGTLLLNGLTRVLSLSWSSWPKALLVSLLEAVITMLAALCLKVVYDRYLAHGSR